VTTTDKQHPQRCETCSRDKVGYPNGIYYCYFLDANINSNEISICGCASHSAAFKEVGYAITEKQMRALSLHLPKDIIDDLRKTPISEAATTASDICKYADVHGTKVYCECEDDCEYQRLFHGDCEPVMCARQPVPISEPVCAYWGKQEGKPGCSLLINDPTLYVKLTDTIKAEAAAEEREKMFLTVRNVINTDCSGLAAALANIRERANGYRWIPDNEWGDYDYTQQTVETLQKECGCLIDEIEKISYEGLRDSGNRIIAHIKEVEKTFYPADEEKHA